MSALPLMIIVLCVLAIAYRYYSAFLAAKVAMLDDTRITPAHIHTDGHNYHPTNKWVLFGHHFAAISGAGPLIGPVLAAQFGYMPGLIWLLIGVCLAGAVQDFLVLVASMRHNGRSLAHIARDQIGPVSGGASIVAILFIIVVALAGLGSAVVKALGGEEFDIPAKSRIVLPADGSLGEKYGHLELPANTTISVPLPVKADAPPGPVSYKSFPLSIKEQVSFSDSKDADRVKGAKPGEPIVLESAGAKRLIAGSSWGVFTIGASIPIALFMGLWMYVLRKNSPTKIIEASAIGVVLMLACVQIGSYIPDSPLGPVLNLSKNQVIIAMAIYGFVASILPVWLLLCPRDYLSSYLKIGTITALVLGVILINPPLKMPAFDTSWGDSGPNFKGSIFPFLFITVMCGAISGFHALVSSGTTPKMVNKESDVRMIGYGAMLVEGLVGIVAIIAACTLAPGDYYGIQIPLQNQAAYHEKVMVISGGDLDHLTVTEQRVGENLRGRTGGAVTLAVGMSSIFAGFSIFEKMMSYWYHFAIMFEALFILTTIDTGTRIGRFLVQEALGKIHPSFGKMDWWPGALIATAIIVGGWSYLLFSGDIATIWPMFGIANQLLAIVALCVVTTYIVNLGRSKYMLVTLGPLCFCLTTTMTAGYQMLVRFYMQAQGTDNAAFRAKMNFVITGIMLICVVVVLCDSIRVWLKARRGGSTPIATPMPAAGN